MQLLRVIEEVNFKIKNKPTKTPQNFKNLFAIIFTDMEIIFIPIGLFIGFIGYVLRAYIFAKPLDSIEDWRFDRFMKKHYPDTFEEE